MEEKNIIYTGITQATSDLDCPDGDLSISHNIINQNGTMKPIWVSNADFFMNDGEKLLYIHSTSDYKNYIYLKENNIKAFKRDNNNRIDYDFSYNLYGEKINSVQSIGNTLIFLIGNGLIYVLWKEDDYISLGNKIPEVPMQFGLEGRARLYSVSDESHSTFKISFNGIAEGNLYETFTEENQTKITEQVMAKVNRFVREQTIKQGRFCFPFFVRYALRLFDGTLVNHSAPILMNPSTESAPIVFWKRVTGKGSYTDAELDIMLVAASLNYRILSSPGISAIKDNWRDIVKGIEIYISAPIYTYNQSGLCKSFNDVDNFETSFIGKLYRKNYTRSQMFTPNGTIAEDVMMGPFTATNGYYPFLNIYSEWSYKHIYGMYFSADRSYPSVSLNMPEKDAESLREELLNTSLFYFLESISTENLKISDWNQIEVADTYLENITLKQQMTDDYQTHDCLSASYSLAYNERLNIANVKRELFDGFTSVTMFSCKEYSHDYSIVDNSTHELKITLGLQSNLEIYTYINEGGRDIIVKSESIFLRTAPFLSEQYTSGYGKKSWPSYLFYPNTNAYKMVITDSMYGSYEIELREHSGLNGAYALIDYNVVLQSMNVHIGQVSENKAVHDANKLYTSEVGNPFYFPLTGINTVGVGKIVGISSTTQALSQGQFGQFPLLVFATDGIWAMEISSTGLYSTKQPMSRDVCSNPGSITQIDNAVVFVSNKGVMIVNGNEVSSISAELDGSSFDKNSIKMLDSLLEKEGLLNEVGEKMPANKFFSNCKIAYDYPNGRLILFKDDEYYAYVYSLYSHSWATMSSDFKFAVTDYPNTYIQKGDNGVVNISEKINFDSLGEVTTLMLSRPMKLGDDVYKTVNTIINRGAMRRNRGAIVVFASLDGLEYFPIGSAIGNQISRLQGSPYRYFRLATIGKMTIKETLSMSSIYYTPKWRNRPR